MWAGIWRKLFGNNGAGPQLRQDILPDIPANLLPNIPASLLPAATAATATAPGAAGLLALAAGNDTASWDKAAPAAGVAAQIASIADLGGLKLITISQSGLWTPPKLGACFVLAYGGAGGAGGCARATGGSAGNNGTSTGGPGGAGGSMFFLHDIASLEPWAITIGEGGAGGTNATTGTGDARAIGGNGGGATLITIPSVGSYGVGGGGGGGGGRRNWKDITAVYGGGPGNPGGITAEPGKNGGSPSRDSAAGGGVITLTAAAFSDKTRPLFHIDGKDFGRGATITTDYATAPKSGQPGAVLILM